MEVREIDVKTVKSVKKSVVKLNNFVSIRKFGEETMICRIYKVDKYLHNSNTATQTVLHCLGKWISIENSPEVHH